MNASKEVESIQEQVDTLRCELSYLTERINEVYLQLMNLTNFVERRLRDIP